MLVAQLDWGFPRFYQTEDGTCYSYLFQNRYKKTARDMFILVAHNPDPSWVRIEANVTRGEEDLPQDVAKQLHRITGLFSFNLRSRDGKLSVVHANPIVSPRVQANAVFVNISNKHAPDKNYRYIIEDSEIQNEESFHWVNNLGPFKVGSGSVYRNKLVGVLPYGTRVKRLEIVETDSGTEVRDEKVFIVDPDQGFIPVPEAEEAVPEPEPVEVGSGGDG